MRTVELKVSGRWEVYFINGAVDMIANNSPSSFPTDRKW